MKSKMALAAILLFFSVSVFSQTQPDTTLSFPQVADGQLGNGSIVSCIGISNPSASTANVRVEFFAGGGDRMTLTVNIVGTGRRTGNVIDNLTIPSNGSALILTAGDSPQLKVGWAKATSNVPVAGTLEYALNDSNFNLQTQAGWGISRAVRNFQIPAFNDSYFGSTGVAWANPGGTSATIEGVLVDNTGRCRQRKTFSLNSNNQQPRFLREMFENMPADGFTGSVYFFSSVDVAPVGLLLNQNILSGLAIVQLADRIAVANCP
jgi:hypothetical protein